MMKIYKEPMCYLQMLQMWILHITTGHLTFQWMADSHLNFLNYCSQFEFA